MALEIQFLGGTGTVTGSKYLVSCNNRKILIDCGLFQGLKSLRLKNWDQFPVDPSTIEAIILTHAHIDHSGYIPRLIKLGFRGKIFATEATRQTCEILLPDSGYLLEEEAAYLNKIHRSKHKPALPLFTKKEAEESLTYFQDVKFNEITKVSADLSFEFFYAGHILGAASLVLTADGKKVAFTGDIGRMEDAIFYPPASLPQVDYLVTESTYGDRLHEKTHPLEEIEKIVNQAIQNDGVIIIPAFAVGRAQSIMYYLSVLRKQKRIPVFPMFLNSPMATDFSDVFIKHKHLHRLTSDECVQLKDVMTFVRSTEESKSLNLKNGPMLIISASGMLTGGRVLHHLKTFAPFSKNTILLTGYQALGTRGEALLKGSPEIKIHGQYIPVNAQIRVLNNVSAHADYGEIIQWFKQANLKPKRVFITHGDPAASDQLRRRLTETFEWQCEVPELGQKVVLT